VPTFAVKVEKRVYDAVAADYMADKAIDGKPDGAGSSVKMGIEGGRIVGRKAPGSLGIDWVPVTDGAAITEWN
jgi:hypothetical protein